MTKISIAVLGGGSLGLLLAAGIGAAGFGTSVWTRTREQALLLAEQGILLKDADGTAIKRVSVQAAPIEEAPANIDGLIVFNALKQTGLTEPLLRQLDSVLAKNAAIVSFCNGIGHIERIAAAVPGRPQLAAVTTEGALRTGPAEVMHTGNGGIWLGRAPLFEGTSSDYVQMPTEDRIKGIANVVREAGFSIFLSNNMTERILRKLLVNSVINPLTAVLRVRNGELLATEDRLRLMRSLFEETLSILQGSGLPGSEGLWEELLDVCARTARNESSMLQDVRNGRATEIEAINGAVARLAADRGLPAPRNETMAGLIRSLSGE